MYARFAFAGFIAFAVGGLNAAENSAARVPGRLLVHLTRETGEPALSRALAHHRARVSRRFDRLGFAVIDVPEDSIEVVRTELGRNAAFRHVEFDYYAHTGATPNDPSYKSQWHLPKIQAPSAWDYSTGLSNVVVAVVDSGVDGTHPDLATRVLPGWNFVADNSDTSDVLGHGTAVAGTVGAVTNNGSGVSGVTWNNPILPVVVVDDKDFAAYSNVAAGIQYAADHGARIINVSIGGNSPSYALESAVDYAWNKGAIVFASAMNDGSVTPMYPASCKHVIAVAATDAADNLARFSNHGSWIALAAPGTNILTTNAGGGYGYWNGTSFAAPVAAGVGALVLSVNPSLGAQELITLLERTADDIGARGFDSQFGWGRVNAYRAILAATGIAAPPPAPALISIAPAAVSVTAGQALQFTASVSGVSEGGLIWSVNPPVGSISADGLYTAPPFIGASQTITITAASAVDPGISASVIITLKPAPSAPPVTIAEPIRINAGGPSYLDGARQLWSADTGFAGGNVWNTWATIAGTAAPALYQTCRYGDFTYTIAVPAGRYNVTLKFAEVSQSGPGQRLFNVAINGALVLAGFDIFAEAGGANIALDKTFPVEATGGRILIQFGANGSANSPLVSAVEITPR